MPAIYWFVLCSGAAGLIYEILWIKRSALAFGSSALALSTVLAVFFTGLGLGSFLFGRWGRHFQRPLLVCACLEVAMAAYGMANPWLFDLADTAYGAIYRSFDLGSSDLWLLRAGLVAALLLPPTLLMGGTLPLFCRQLVDDPNCIAGRIGFIYGINTLGAALGCIAAGFWLVPGLGLNLTGLVAAGFNAVAAFGFYRLAQGLTPLAVEYSQPGKPAEPRRDTGPFLLAATLFFLIGAATLASELVWARFLTNFLRNSVFTYTLTLAVVLTGTMLGSLWAGPRLDRFSDRRSLLAGFAALQATSAILTLVLLNMPVIGWLYLKLYGPLPYFVLMLPPALIAGASFPLLNRLVIDDPREASRQLGGLTAVNIAGCIAGSLLTGFFLLPTQGLETSIQATTGAGIGAAILAATASIRLKPRNVLHWASFSVALAGAMLWLGRPAWSPVRLPQDYIAQPQALVDFTEGYNSTLAVIRRGDTRIMLVDQLWQGTSRRNHQVMAAHLPMLHYPEAKEVLVIGLGVGQTASRFLHYPIERLDIVDIEPALFDFVRHNFDSAWMNDRTVRLQAEDGRNFVRHTSQRYDLLSVEVGQLFRPGVDVFYTAEFYREARARLTDQGMIVQFLPLELIKAPELGGILNTFLDVFPSASLWYNSNELLLMGFAGPARFPGPEALARALDQAPSREDFQLSYWGGPRYALSHWPVLLGSFLATGDELRALAKQAGDARYSDDRPQLAYAVAGFNEKEVRTLALVPMIRDHLSPFDRLTGAGAVDADTLALADAVRQRNVGDIAAANLLELIEPERETNPDDTTNRLAEVLRWNPQHQRALKMMGEALIRAGRDYEALDYLRRSLALDDTDPHTQQKLGFALVRTRQLQAALPHLEKSLSLNPNEAETLNTLAVALANLGRIEEALPYFRRAAALEPGNPEAQRNLKNAEAMLLRKR